MHLSHCIWYCGTAGTLTYVTKDELTVALAGPEGKNPGSGRSRIFKESQAVVSTSDSKPEETHKLFVSQAERRIVQSLSEMVCSHFRLPPAESSSFIQIFLFGITATNSEFTSLSIAPSFRGDIC